MSYTGNSRKLAAGCERLPVADSRGLDTWRRANDNAPPCAPSRPRSTSTLPCPEDMGPLLPSPKHCETGTRQPPTARPHSMAGPPMPPAWRAPDSLHMTVIHKKRPSCTPLEHMLQYSPQSKSMPRPPANRASSPNIVCRKISTKSTNISQEGGVKADKADIFAKHLVEFPPPAAHSSLSDTRRRTNYRPTQ